MTPEEIAAEACKRSVLHRGSVGWDIVLRAVKAAIAAEREACAKVAETLIEDETDEGAIEANACRCVAAAIRARKP